MNVRLVVALVGALLAGVPLAAQAPPTIDISVFSRMTWRALGPFRSGAATAAAASAEPGVFFEGVAGSGLWRTSDNGASWALGFEPPIEHAVSAIAVAPSTPSLVYAGLARSDERQADAGLYRSNDGGRTWTATGLDTTGSVTAIAVDIRDASQLWVAVSSAAAGANRGALLHSVDAGRTFRPSTLGANGGSALNVVQDPVDAATLYAVIRPSTTAGAVVYRSTNGGSDWRPLTNGLPDSNVLTSRGFAIAPSSPDRLYATADVDGRLQLFRSDDRGDSWRAAGGTVPSPAPSTARTLSVDPHTPDRVVLVADSPWTSSDGGRTLSPLSVSRIGPTTGVLVHSPQPGVLVVGGSQGLAISVNSGQTWSSPFTQPTADVATAIADGAFPFRVCGAQEGTGPICVPSRVERDRIGLPQWQVIPLGRNAAPDPNDADILYDGSGARFDRRTGQVVDVGPAEFMGGADAVPAFSPDGRTMYLADRTIRRTLNAGQAWTTIATSDAGARFSALAVSAIDARTIWTGATDGSVRVSRDGGASWTANTSVARDSILRIEPSHFDTQSAYLVLTSGARPLRTRDGGASWQPMANGLASAGRVFVVREDPFRRGLLLAGTERSVFVSFDDGESWQPWRLNLPGASVRDLTLRDATLVAATGGRGFWVLDDISPLRQLTADVGRADAFLFRPAPAYRLRAVSSRAAAGDAPTPDPAPEGAVFSFLVGPNVRGPVSVEVIETAADEIIRRYDFTAEGQATAGLHQIVWDLRYGPPTSSPSDRGPLVVPGTYQVRLTVNGRALRQAVVVRMDPRLRAPAAELTAQLILARRIATQISQADRALNALPVERRTVLLDAVATLRRLALRVEDADARPSAALEAEAAAALARAIAAAGPS